MLSKSEASRILGCYKVEILRRSLSSSVAEGPQNDIATQFAGQGEVNFPFFAHSLLLGVAFEPLIGPATYFLLLVPVFRLQGSLELLIVSLDLLQVIIGDLAPLLFELPFKLCPSTLELILVHNILSMNFDFIYFKQTTCQ